MTSTSRRDLLRAAAAMPMAFTCGPAPLVAGAPQPAPREFAHGGLRGFNVGDVARCDGAFVDALMATGANVARVAFAFRRCRGCNRFSASQSDTQAMLRLLHWAGERRLRLVVVGWFDDVAEPSFWREPALHDSVVENWAWFARTFGNHSAIAGLDLLNEPNPPKPSGGLAAAQGTWHALAERAIAAIRAAGVTLPVVFQPVEGGGALGMRDMRPLADQQVVYSVHFYIPHGVTHQRVGPDWMRPLRYPAGVELQVHGGDPELGFTAFDAQRLTRELRHARAFQLRHGVPLFVGEFSCVRWAPDGSAYRWLSDSLDIFTRYGWSWAYHEFRGWPGWDAEIASEDPGEVVRDAKAPTMQLLRQHMSRPGGLGANIAPPTT